MKLALLGFPIKHSLSPSLYQKLLGQNLSSYDLLEIESAAEIPSLQELQKRYDGINITAPYKGHFFSQVHIRSALVNEIGAINTIGFKDGEAYGTNTDLVAIKSMLQEFLQEHKTLFLIILGNGVMARATTLVADELLIPWRQFARGKGDDLAHLDLSSPPSTSQTIVINSCSRGFVFQGQLNSSYIFWDYNYSFLPHQNSLPFLVRSYVDGQEMLKRQALAAVDFWKQTNPKLKC